MSRATMIDRLLNCRNPARFSKYSRKWYNSRTDAQLYSMFCEIRETDEEDYSTKQSTLKYSPEYGEYIVLTESGNWEKAYN